MQRLKVAFKTSEPTRMFRYDGAVRVQSIELVHSESDSFGFLRRWPVLPQQLQSSKEDLPGELQYFRTINGRIQRQS